MGIAKHLGTHSKSLIVVEAHLLRPVHPEHIGFKFLALRDLQREGLARGGAFGHETSEKKGSTLRPNLNIVRYMTKMRRSMHSLSPIGFEDNSVPTEGYEEGSEDTLPDFGCTISPRHFYLNLVDWSSHNVLAVGLGNCVYL